VLAECGVGDGLQRLVQDGEFARDPEQRILLIEAAVQRVDLLAEAVESRENGVQLAVAEILRAFHAQGFYCEAPTSSSAR
jgi:hypothetical protein